MLELVSLVGVDEKTNLDELIALDQSMNDAYGDLNDSIFNEYGFLWSESRSQTNDKRYPSYDFIDRSVRYLTKHDVATSVHLCGQEAVTKYLKGETEILDLIVNSRVQLNFSMSNYKVEELLPMVIEAAQRHPFPLILQANKSKKDFVDALVKYQMAHNEFLNIDLLHDGSGGFGKEIQHVDKPYKQFFTGYAGGLKPGNIDSVLSKIYLSMCSRKDGHFVFCNSLKEIGSPGCICYSQHSNFHTNLDAHSLAFDSFYIDMESGIRTENLFSLEKCEAVSMEVIDFHKKMQKEPE